MAGITKELVYEAIENTRQYYEYMALVDKTIRVCGYGEGYNPEIHIFRKETFLEICKVLEMDYKEIANTRRLEIVVNSVHIFTLKEKEEDAEQRTAD